MNKHIFFGIISVTNKTWLANLIDYSIKTLIKFFIFNDEVEETVPVYEAISVPHIEPFHCALNQAGCNNRRHMIKSASQQRFT